MKLVYNNGIFALSATYEEEDTPKSSGFNWDPSFKHWWTTDPEIAAQFYEWADPNAKEILEPYKKEMDEEVRMSKATDSSIQIPVPYGKEYYPYQRAGIEYALRRDRTLIADSMGLGKTVQAIGVSNADPDIQKVLIVCPASLKLNWLNEFHEWDTKGMMVGMIEGKDEFPVIPSNSALIINYDILQKFRSQLRAVDWDLLVVDESHYLKNPIAKRTEEVLGRGSSDPDHHIEPIPGKRKLFLTGTPILNRPHELWTVLREIDPKKLGSDYREFRDRYCNGNNGGKEKASNLGELQEKLRASGMIRRLKSEVLNELPDKNRQVISLPEDQVPGALENERMTLEELREMIINARQDVHNARNEEEYRNAIAILNKTRGHALSEIARLRKETAHRKLPWVIAHAYQALANGQKVVLFAYHHEIIERLMDEYPNASIFTGKQSKKEKDEAVRRFQNGVCDVFVGSIAAAGTGINLTRANTVIFGELVWTPSGMNQAEDRAHRVGQSDTVLIQHVVLDGSIDSMMADRLVEKQRIIDKALDDHQADSNEVEETEDRLLEQLLQIDVSTPENNGPKDHRIEENARSKDGKQWREERGIHRKPASQRRRQRGRRLARGGWYLPPS